jgi:hypothetical protein
MNWRWRMPIGSNRPVLLALATLAAGTCLGGCVYMPTPEHGSHRITQKTALTIQAGKTRREDVLLNFAEPSRSVGVDRVFVYEWTGTEGYAVALVPVYPGCCMAGSVERLRAFCVSFDAAGTVTDSALFEEAFFEDEKTYRNSVEKWIDAQARH